MVESRSCPRIFWTATRLSPFCKANVYSERWFSTPPNRPGFNAAGTRLDPGLLILLTRLGEFAEDILRDGSGAVRHLTQIIAEVESAE